MESEKALNVLITGCSTGIGFATAELFARSGHNVYASMRNPKANPALSEIAHNENLPITILTMDVLDDKSVKTAITAAIQHAGQIDILINNAGIASVGSVEEMPIETFQSVMQTNFFGSLRCIQAVVAGMRKRRSGCIINVTSVAGKIYGPCFAAYVSSKAATEAMSESLASELAQFGIRVHVIQPGVIDTPLIDKLPGAPANTVYSNHARLEAYLKASAAHHVMPAEVAETILAVACGEQTAFRNPVGEDAAPLLAWRAGLSDEDWIAAGSIDEATWAGNMEQMGMDVMAHI